MFDGRLVRKRWREDKEEDEGVKEEMQEVTSEERPTLREFRGRCEQSTEEGGGGGGNRMDPHSHSSLCELTCSLT